MKASIIINNYNYAAYLERSILSALTQTYRPREIVVVDDGSSDESRAILERYADRVIVVLKSNGGQGSALNAGCSSCTGDLVLFLDADDYWAADKVATCVSYFASHPEVGYVHHSLSVVNARGEIIWPNKGSRLSCGRLDPQKAFAMQYSFAPTSCIGIRRSILERLLPIPEDVFRLRADYYLQTMPTLYTRIGCIDQALTFYRIHGQNRFSGLVSPDRLRRDLDVIEGFARFLKTQLGEPMLLDENYYYVRGKLFTLGQARQRKEAWNVLRRYLWALRKNDSEPVLRIVRALTACMMFLHPMLGLRVFNFLAKHRLIKRPVG